MQTLRIVDDEGNPTDQTGDAQRIGWWIDPQSGQYAHGVGGAGAGEGLVDEVDVPSAVRAALAEDAR